MTDYRLGTLLVEDTFNRAKGPLTYLADALKAAEQT